MQLGLRWTVVLVASSSRVPSRGWCAKGWALARGASLFSRHPVADCSLLSASSLLPHPHSPYLSRGSAMSALMGWAGMLGRPEDSTGGNWV